MRRLFLIYPNRFIFSHLMRFAGYGRKRLALLVGTRKLLIWQT